MNRMLQTLFARTNTPARRSDRCRLFVQNLEERAVPATFSVTNVDDAGPGSLRAAITTANASLGDDTISFDPVVFNVPKLINLSSGDIDITDALTIAGPTSRLTVDAGSLSRHFTIDTAVAGAKVSISNMTLSHGKAVADFGGAIFNQDANLTLTEVKIENNTAALGGGGIYVASAAVSLYLESCSVNNNTATDKFGAGGAMYLKNAAVVSINRCTIAGNEAGNSGGAISFYEGGSLTITDSTIWGNQANLTNNGTGGGALSIVEGTSLLRNCTLAGNSAKTGGALLTFQSDSIVLENCTLAYNSASNSGGAIANNWGMYSANISMESTLIANNSAPNASNVDGEIDAINSLIGSALGAVISGGGNVVNVDPMLGPLGGNGGKTLTVELLSGSPAINAGSNSAKLLSDQRGGAFARSVGAATDIGAFELQGTVVTNANGSGAGSLRQAVENANFQVGADIISFDTAAFATAKTIALTVGQLHLLEAVTINGPASGVTIDAGELSRHFRIDVAGSNSNPIALSNLTLINGNGNTGTGGSIYNFDEALSLTNVKIANSTTTKSGGAIDVGDAAGSLTLLRCTLTSNMAGENGGAISLLAGGSVTIIDSAFILNQAALDGGGLYAVNGTAIVRNSTVVSNFASNGAGLAVAGNATLAVQNTTCAFNSATASGGGVHKAGTASVVLTSSIVGANSAPVGPDIIGSLGANFSLLSTTSGGSVLGVSNKLNVNPLLASPALNGGATPNCLLLPGSPAINAGSNPTALTNDQRGIGFPRVLGGTIDIGSAERLNTEVNNTNDTGLGSLRFVLGETNLVAGHNTVTFDKSVFAGAKTIVLSSGQLTIADAVTIIGANALLTLDAGALSRHFMIDAPGGGGHVVKLVNLRLVNGRAIGGNGGSIFNADAALTLDFVRIENSKSDNNGGAVALGSSAASLFADECAFTNNAATTKGSRGGAIFVAGASTVTIYNSTVDSNSAGHSGGAIDFAAAGTLTIIGSTISGNHANGGVKIHGGGGLYLGTSSAIIRNTTISGNSAVVGGGIDVLAGAAVTLQNSTVAFNTATTQGGGINNPSNAVVTATSTIVGKNQAPSGADVSGKITANFSLVGNTAGAAVSGANNIVNFDPLLSPLSDHGGVTMTHALLSGSKAIDAGSNPGKMYTDQRGVSFPRTTSAGTDIGAYEVDGLPIHVTVQINGGVAQRSRVTSLTVSFDQTVTLPVNPVDAFELIRQSDNADVALNAQVVGNTVTLTFIGGPVNGNSLADGRYTLIVLAAEVPNLDGNGDNSTGDNYKLTGNPDTNTLFRLFGDADGNGLIDLTDFAAFRPAFGNASSIFSSDGTGPVDLLDFGQFRSRYGMTI